MDPSTQPEPSPKEIFENMKTQLISLQAAAQRLPEDIKSFISENEPLDELHSYQHQNLVRHLESVLLRIKNLKKKVFCSSCYSEREYPSWFRCPYCPLTYLEESKFTFRLE
jgi:hypothetical protein